MIANLRCHFKDRSNNFQKKKLRRGEKDADIGKWT